MIKINSKDQNLIYQLSLNSKQTNKQIAKQVRLSEQVVGYRIKKLVEKKIINYFYIRTNSAKLGYLHYKIFLKTKNLDEETEKEFVSALKNNKNIIWVVSTRGDFDYIISILAKNIHEFSEVYKKISSRFSQYILHRNVSIIEKASTFSRDYLIEKESKEFKYGGQEKLVKLDEDDFKLLQLITLNARMSAIEIAQKMEVSADKIIYRLKKLKESSFLTGFGVNLNLKKLGVKQYILALKLQNMSEAKYNKLKEIAKKNKSIQYFIRIIGDHDLELELEIQNDQQLDNLFNELKKEFIFDLIEYELLEITEEHKLNYFPF
jgi:Lrp/AsnC family transcriptional regulator, leucine-responsive regulatory protein